MISKEKKAAIIAEVRQKRRRYRFTGGTDRDPYCQNRRAYRAFKGQPEGSSLQTHLLGNDRVRDVSITFTKKKDRRKNLRHLIKVRHQKVITDLRVGARNGLRPSFYTCFPLSDQAGETSETAKGRRSGSCAV